MPEFIWELPAVRPEPEAQPSTSEGAVDHVSAALRRLVLQFQKPKMKAMVRCFVTPIQKVEQAIVDLLTQRTLDNAQGEQLNVLGRIVGQDQVEVTDTTYRSLIRARIPANKSNGLAEDVILVARLVFSDYAGQEDVVAAGVMRLQVTDYQEAEFAIVVHNLDLPWDIATLFAEQFLREITAAGVRGVLEYAVQEYDDLDAHDHAFDLGDAAEVVVLSNLEKTGGVNAVFDAGASSVQTIAGDGYVEFQPGSVSYYIIGLSADDPALDRDEIDFGIYLRNDANGFSFAENGALTHSLVAYTTDDIFRIERVGTTVRAYRNGALMHTFAAVSNGPLLIDTAFYNTGATLANVNLVDDGEAVDVTWQNVVNVTITDGDDAMQVGDDGLGDLVSYPRDQAEAQAVIPWGTWNHGHLCDNTFGGDVATWGGFDLAENGLIEYDEDGAIPNDYDRAFGVGIPGTYFSTNDASLQADAADDFAFAAAIAELGDQGGSEAALLVFGSFAIFGNKLLVVAILDAQLYMVVLDGATQVETAKVDLPTSGPFAIMGVLERGTNKMRVSACKPGGVAVASAEVDVSAIGSLTHAQDTFIGAGDWATTTKISHWMASHGVAACTGLSANLPAAVEAYAATMAIGGFLNAAIE